MVVCVFVRVYTCINIWCYDICASLHVGVCMYCMCVHVLYVCVCRFVCIHALPRVCIICRQGDILNRFDIHGATERNTCTYLRTYTDTLSCIHAPTRVYTAQRRHSIDHYTRLMRILMNIPKITGRVLPSSSSYYCRWGGREDREPPQCCPP